MVPSLRIESEAPSPAARPEGRATAAAGPFADLLSANIPAKAAPGAPPATKSQPTPASEAAPASESKVPPQSSTPRDNPTGTETGPRPPAPRAEDDTQAPDPQASESQASPAPDPALTAALAASLAPQPAPTPEPPTTPGVDPLAVSAAAAAPAGRNAAAAAAAETQVPPPAEAPLESQGSVPAPGQAPQPDPANPIPVPTRPLPTAGKDSELARQSDAKPATEVAGPSPAPSPKAQAPVPEAVPSPMPKAPVPTQVQVAQAPSTPIRTEAPLRTEVSESDGSSTPGGTSGITLSFKGGETRSAADPGTSFTLKAEAHPLVRELMAQPRVEAEPAVPVPIKTSPKVDGIPTKPGSPLPPEAVPGEAPQAARQEMLPLRPLGEEAPALEKPAMPAPVSSQGPAPVQPHAQATFTAPLPNTLASPATPVQQAAPAAMAPHPAAIQVEGSIRWLLSRERAGAELQLHPESLGRVTIQLRVEGSEVHARVWATEPSTVPLLQEHRGHLEVSLREQGLSLGSFDLHQGQRGGQPAPDPASWSGSATRMDASEGLESRQESPASLPSLSAHRGRLEVFA